MDPAEIIKLFESTSNVYYRIPKKRWTAYQELFYRYEENGDYWSIANSDDDSASIVMDFPANIENYGYRIDQCIDEFREKIKNSPPNFNNFAMLLPNDIHRHPDGSPVLFVSPEDKVKFVDWATHNFHDLESMDIKQRESLFLTWKYGHE